MNGLLNSITLDVMIGLTFVYLLLAILCTTVNEWVGGWFKLRSKTLASGIKQLLDTQPGPGGDANWFLQKFHEHPLIAGMLVPGKSGGKAYPSYLPSRTFATAVMDIVTANKPGSIGFTDLETGIKALPDGDVKKALLALIQNSHGSLLLAQKNIETWFDDTMDRASGWYKRQTQLITVLVAIVLTGLTNADTVNIVRTLWNNPTQRALLVQQAQTRSNEAKEASSTSETVSSKDELAALGGVLGWPKGDQAKQVNWPERLLGWFLTIVAVSLGAPFWFDLLNKFINIRNAGNKPKTSEETPAKPGPAPSAGQAQGGPNAQPA
jgi:hypothetical protein